MGTLDDQIRAIVREELQRSAPAATLYTSKRLPPDVIAAATFNRACRAGLVNGAEKHGRSWVCSGDAWAEYRRSVARRAKPGPVKIQADDLLTALGAKRRA